MSLGLIAGNVQAKLNIEQQVKKVKASLESDSQSALAEISKKNCDKTYRNWAKSTDPK